MAENTSNPETNLVTRLHNAINTCNKIVKPPLEKQREILNEYANGWYSSKQRTRKPLNMISRAINLLLPLLASRNPRAMVRPRVVQLTPFADTLRLTLNHLSEKTHLGTTLEQVVLYALVYMGIIKTGIAAGGPKVKDAQGYFHDSGQLFCDIIHPEDYFFDVSARIREEMDFEGNWYYVPFEYIADSGKFENYDKLVPAYSSWDKLSAKKISEDSRNFRLDTIKPYVKIGEVWIPGENILMTIPQTGQGSKPLRVQDYVGPVSGPYDTLCFNTFPESIIPIAPLFTNLDLHYLINIMARKMARQANREKKILAYQGTAADDAERITNATDGATARVDDINAMKEVEYGGTADASYTWIQWLVGKWSEQLGNANLIGGIQAQSPTLGQDQMLLANASASIDYMIDKVHGLIRNMFNKMAWYVFTDPLMDITVSKRVAGLAEIPVRITADTREGDFWSYNFDVEPYSMQRMSPTSRRNSIMQLTTGIIVPLANMIQAQGGIIDVAKLVKSISRDTDLTDAEIDEFFKTVYTNTDLGPYSPTKGVVGGIKGVGDQLGASPASRAVNLSQQQARAGGQPSPPNKPEVTGV